MPMSRLFMRAINRHSKHNFINQQRKYISGDTPKLKENANTFRSWLLYLTKLAAFGTVGVAAGYGLSDLYKGNEISYFPFIKKSSKVENSIHENDKLEMLEAQGLVTERVFLDVVINGGHPERLVIGLYGQECPKTVNNFASLCDGFQSKTKHLHYLNSKFHRIIPNFMIQGGDYTHFDGTGGQSIYDGGVFKDECFQFKHDRFGAVSMANRGKDTNSSQFFLCLGPAPWLDGRHVVFGQVLFGAATLKKMEAVGSRSGKVDGQVVIVACGRLPALHDTLSANSPKEEQLDSDGRASNRIMK